MSQQRVNVNNCTIIVDVPREGLLQGLVLAEVLAGALDQHVKKDPEYQGVWREAPATEQIALSAHKLRRIDALVKANAPYERVTAEAVDALNYLGFGLRQVAADFRL